MRRTLVLAAIAALALAAAPAAGAKEIRSAEVCGTDSCATVDDEAGRFALMGAGPPMSPPPRAAYFEVNARFAGEGHSETITFVAVPEHRAVRYADGAWYQMTAEQQALIGELTAGAKAFPAAGLIGAAKPPAKPAPAPAASDGGSLLWPEGILVALVLAAGGVLLVRAPTTAAR
jgi:hypothetical protein